MSNGGLPLVGSHDPDYGRGYMEQTIYKVCTKIEWLDAKQNGIYLGSGDDVRDGFIHFSSAEQLSATLSKHFAGQDDLVLVSVKTTALGNLLKWEGSRGGKLFPHLYGPLPVASATKVQDLTLGSDGHALPELDDT